MHGQRTMTSKPEFSARVLGMTNSASANACTPSLALPVTSLLYSTRWRWAASSKAPAPGTSALSSMAFLTARRPSLTASFSCAMVCGLGPFIRMEHENGLATSSMNVYFSSPSVCWYTLPAVPRHSSSRPSSTELRHMPPQARMRRSMLRR